MSAPAAAAAREFNNGPQVWEAARLLLGAYPLTALCEALKGANSGDDVESLLTALERLAEFEEVRRNFLADPTLATFLQQGAGSGASSRVRLAVARLIARFSHEEAGIARLIDVGLLAACEQLLMDEDTGTGEAAAKTLCHATQWQLGRNAVLGSEKAPEGVAQRLLGRLSTLPDVQRVRTLHFFVELGRCSDVTFQALEAAGAYKEVLGAFFTDDILLKLNTVELMDALGVFQAGQDFLKQRGVPQQLASELTDPMNDSSVKVCVVRLLGLIISRSPESIEVLLPDREAPLAKTLVEFLDNRKDPTERMVALHTWGNVAGHAVGLAFFLRWPEIMEMVISLAGAAQNEICQVGMACWASVLNSFPAPENGVMEVDEANTPGPQQLWDVAEQRLLPQVLKNLTTKPFPELRAHTWRLLAVLTRSRSISQKQLTAEEMRDILFDFTSETTGEPRIAKHEFASALLLHQGSWLSGFLDESLDNILNEYVRQGPHWVPRNASAAIAEQTG